MVVLFQCFQMLANKSTRLQRILEETKEADGEAQIRDRMQLLSTQLSDCISKLHETFTSQIFVAISRAFWDKMGQVSYIYINSFRFSPFFLIESFIIYMDLHLLDCAEVLGRAEGKSSVVHGIVSCSRGKKTSLLHSEGKETTE